MSLRLITICIAFIALGCGGGETVGTNTGQGGSGGSGGSGSGGDAGMMAMQGGGTLPPMLRNARKAVCKPGSVIWTLVTQI